MPPGAGHSENSSSPFHKTPHYQTLCPVYNTVSHNIKRHFHLSLSQSVFGFFRNKRLERSEGKRMKKHFDRRSGIPGKLFLYIIKCFRLLDGIGRIDIVKNRLCSGMLNFFYNFLNQRHRCLSIQMDAENIIAYSGQFDCSRSSETARCAENQCPFVMSRSCICFHLLTSPCR